MSRRVTSIIATAVAVTALAAVASYLAHGSTPSQAARVAATASPSPAAYTQDDQTATDRYPETGLTIEPPSQATSPQPSITADQAWNAVKTAGSPFLTGTGRTDPHLKLVSLTDTVQGVTNKDGSFTPEYPAGLLVWLVELPHATVLRTNNGLEETAFIMVDAHTGKALYSLQSANFHT
jgi:hypothetical protein